MCVKREGVSSRLLDHTIEMECVSLFYHTRIRDLWFKGVGCDTSLLNLKGVSSLCDSIFLFRRRVSRLLYSRMLFKDKGYGTILLYSIKVVSTIKGWVCHYPTVWFRREGAVLHSIRLYFTKKRRHFTILRYSLRGMCLLGTDGVSLLLYVV